MASLAASLIENLTTFTTTSLQENDSLRQRLALAARKLFHELESPGEKAMRLALEEPVMFSVLQTLINTSLFEAWTAAGRGEKTVNELVALTKTGIDVDLLAHQMRLMAANHIVHETGNDRYTPTPFSLSLGDESTLLAPALRVRTDHIAQSALHWPRFLAGTQYRLPVDDKASCYMSAFPENLNFFNRCLSNPVYQESFSSFMEMWTKQKAPWPTFYDTTELLAGAELSDGSAFVVDIGGHHGIDLMRVVEKHPEVPAGSLVLEDLPDVIATFENPTDKIRAVEHDLLKEGSEQPIKGARAYFMHAVLHDWSDESVVQILKQTAAAMKPGYSKLLINDIVIPPTGTSCYQSAMDCFMMHFSAGERTDAVWRKVIKNAGLELVKIWPDGRGYESIVEAQLS